MAPSSSFGSVACPVEEKPSPFRLPSGSRRNAIVMSGSPSGENWLSSAPDSSVTRILRPESLLAAHRVVGAQDPEFTPLGVRHSPPRVRRGDEDGSHTVAGRHRVLQHRVCEDEVIVVVRPHRHRHSRRAGRGRGRHRRRRRFRRGRRSRRGGRGGRAHRNGRRGRRGRWTRAHQSADLTPRDSRAGNADEGDDQYADRPSERRSRATR